MLRLLECIGNLALIPYPFPETATSANAGEDLLVFTLGQIAGMAAKSIERYRESLKEDTK